MFTYFSQHFNTKVTWTYLFLILLSFFLIVFRPETLSFDRAVMSLIIFLIGVFPGIHYISHGPVTRKAFPFLAFIGLFYAIFFGLSGFLDGVLRRNELGQENQMGMVEFFGKVYVEEISLKAQMLVIVGIILLFLSWLLTKTFLARYAPTFRLSVGSSGKKFYFLVWGLVIASLLFLYVPDLRRLPSIGQFLHPAGYVGLAIMSSLYLSGRLPRSHGWAYFFLAFPFWLIGFLKSGLLTPLMLAGGLWVGIYVAYRGKMPWRLIIVFGLIFLSFYSIKPFYIMWVKNPQISIERKMKIIYSQSASGNLSEGPTLLGLYRRSGLIFTLSHVVNKTPKSVPYWNGVTLEPFFTNWIPRIFWSGKPQERAGYEFGVRYGLILKREKQMSFNIPWLTELYANFGVYGVIIGMSLIGCCLSVLDRICNNSNQSLLEFSIGSAIIIPLCFQEQNITVMTGSIVPLIISLWLYFRLGFSVKMRV